MPHTTAERTENKAKRCNWFAPALHSLQASNMPQSRPELQSDCQGFLP